MALENYKNDIYAGVLGKIIGATWTSGRRMDF